MTSQSYLDLIDHEPWDFYEAMRAKGPVHWDERMDAWLVFGFEEAKEVITNEDVFAHPYHEFAGANEVQGGPRGILMLRGEEHHRMHRFLLSLFSIREVDRYRERVIDPLVRRWFDRGGGARDIDLSASIYEQLPSDVIGGLLGLDLHDDQLMRNCRAWNDSIMKWSETFGEDEAILAEALEAAEHLESVILPVIRARQQEPADDFISRLWEAGPEVLEPWTEREVLAQCRVLFFAGSETTAHFLNNITYVLIDRPDWQDRLKTERDLIPAFVEETLRLFGTIHFRVRVAAADVNLGGVQIRKGDRVHPINASANRDPRQFHHPDDIDASRKRPKSHLAFNVGARFCIGANLGRGEAIAVVEELLNRYDSLEWQTGAEEPRFLGHMPRSYRPLNVTLTPAQ